MSSNQKGSCVGQNLCTSSDSVVSSSRTGYGTWSHKLLLNQSFPKNTNKHQFEIIQRCATGSALLNINPGSLTFHYPICFQMRLINHSWRVTRVSSLLRTECSSVVFVFYISRKLELNQIFLRYRLTANIQKTQDFIKRSLIFPICFSKKAMCSPIKMVCLQVVWPFWSLQFQKAALSESYDM